MVRSVKTIVNELQVLRAQGGDEQATEPKEMAIWGGLCVVLAIFVALGKMWYWMDLNKNTVVRELKRVELQIAFLAKSIAAQK